MIKQSQCNNKTQQLCGKEWHQHVHIDHKGRQLVEMLFRKGFVPVLLFKDFAQVETTSYCLTSSFLFFLTAKKRLLLRGKVSW